MPDLKALGERVRKERKRLGLTQTALGEYAGTGINFISQLEQGKETIRFDKLLSVLEVLSLDLKVVRGSGRVLVEEEDY